jgi:hypothetical protein
VINNSLKVASLQFKTVFILENRSYWYAITDIYNKESDLVLTIDLSVKKEVEAIGGTSEFLDHLPDSEYLNSLNYQMLSFLDNWYLVDGEDIFNYNGIEFGNSFKLNLLNDVTYSVHFLTNLLCLNELKFERIICGISDIYIKQSLDTLKLVVEYIDPISNINLPYYYFPIGKWMKYAIEKKSFKRRIVDFLLSFVETINSIRYHYQRDKLSFVYINNYYPTNKIIKKVSSEKKVNLVLNFYTSIKNSLRENRLKFPANKTHKLFGKYADLFYLTRQKSLRIDDIDIGPILYNIIEPIVLSNISNCLNGIDKIVSYFKNKDLRLMIPVTDLWLENRLLMNYCLKRNIPIFMIINGLLTNNSYKDGFDSTWVNAYGSAIKEDYYLNATNIVCLGDTRMDNYAIFEKKIINYSEPTVVIGTSGYNPIDLNSYLAVEYDFLFDILKTIKHLERTEKIKIIIKVRANGYLERYQEFVGEYFKEMNIHIIQNVPFIEVLKKADLYISIYSQTQFEAACLGIPSIYYKKDSEINNRPFDGKSELITANNTKELKEMIIKFFNKDRCYNNFMQKEVLEKYIGPLDGKNCDRNVDFIYSLIK